MKILLEEDVFSYQDEMRSREKALGNIFGNGKADDNENCPTLSTLSKEDLNRTLSPQESLCTSMLRHIDKKTVRKDDLEEAFCRDIDSFNAAFIVSWKDLAVILNQFFRQMMDPDQRSVRRSQLTCVQSSMTAPHAQEGGPWTSLMGPASKSGIWSDHFNLSSSGTFTTGPLTGSTGMMWTQ